MRLKKTMFRLKYYKKKCPIKLKVFVALGLFIAFYAVAIWIYKYEATRQAGIVAWSVNADDRPHTTRALRAPSDRMRILALDGGGIRGLVTLEVLKYLEQTAQKPIS